MSNIAPIAKASIDKTVITLPENNFRISLAGSYDPNRNGIITKWKHVQVSGPQCVIHTPESSESDVECVEAITKENTAVFDSTVQDKRGLTDTARTSILIKPAVVIPVTNTIFGAKLQGTNAEQIAAAKMLNLKSIRPAQINMDVYAGLPQSFLNFVNAGLIPIWNVNWTNTGGDNVLPFVKGDNLNIFKANFTKLCKDLIALRNTLSSDLQAVFDKMKLAIENEPVNRQYYKAPIADYIAQLKAAVEIGNSFGLKVVSGAIHIILVEAVLNGSTGDDRISDTRAIMNAEKTMDVYATNVHDSWKNGYTVPDFTKTVKRLSEYTGHKVGNNEFSSHGITPEVIKDLIAKAKVAGYDYFNYWSGDTFNGVPLPGGTSTGDALQNGTILSNAGIAYKEVLS